MYEYTCISWPIESGIAIFSTKAQAVSFVPWVGHSIFFLCRSTSLKGCISTHIIFIEHVHLHLLSDPPHILVDLPLYTANPIFPCKSTTASPCVAPRSFPNLHWLKTMVSSSMSSCPVLQWQLYVSPDARFSHLPTGNAFPG